MPEMWFSVANRDEFVGVGAQAYASFLADAFVEFRSANRIAVQVVQSACYNFRGSAGPPGIPLLTLV